MNISSVASCGRVASSSSAWARSFFGFPKSARLWQGGERVGNLAKSRNRARLMSA